MCTCEVWTKWCSKSWLKSAPLFLPFYYVTSSDYTSWFGPIKSFSGWGGHVNARLRESYGVGRLLTCIFKFSPLKNFLNPLRLRDVHWNVVSVQNLTTKPCSCWEWRTWSKFSNGENLPLLLVNPIPKQGFAVHSFIWPHFREKFSLRWALSPHPLSQGFHVTNMTSALQDPWRKFSRVTQIAIRSPFVAVFSFYRSVNLSYPSIPLKLPQIHLEYFHRFGGTHDLHAQSLYSVS